MKKHTLQICKDTRRDLKLQQIEELYNELFFIRNKKAFVNKSYRKQQSENIKLKISIKEYELQEFIKLNY